MTKDKGAHTTRIVSVAEILDDPRCEKEVMLRMGEDKERYAYQYMKLHDMLLATSVIYNYRRIIINQSALPRLVRAHIRKVVDRAVTEIIRQNQKEGI